MNKGLVVLTIFAITLFLTGCGETTTTGKSFIGGTEGLKASFLAGNPPTITTDNGTTAFNIIVKLENVGESNVKATDGYVEIWGADASTYNAASKYPEFRKQFTLEPTFGEELQGARMNYGNKVTGGTSTVTFEDLSYLSRIAGDTSVQPISANICYKYNTQATAELCIKNNLEQALGGKEICNVEEEKNPQNSGAPIQVTSLKEYYAGGGKIGITVTIEHVGKGKAFFKDDQIRCLDVPSNTDKGKVKVVFKNVELGGKSIPVVCPGISDGGYVRLFSDNGGKEFTNVQCTIDTTGTKNIVQVPIELELSYVYLQNVDTTLTVRHIAQ